MGYTRSACGGITERKSSRPHRELSGADSKVSVSPTVCRPGYSTNLTGGGPVLFLVTAYTFWLMVMIWSNVSIIFSLGVSKTDELELKRKTKQKNNPSDLDAVRHQMINQKPIHA